jgi:hypothetical protein
MQMRSTGYCKCGALIGADAEPSAYARTAQPSSPRPRDRLNSRADREPRMGLAAKRELAQGADAQRSLLRTIAEVRPLALRASGHRPERVAAEPGRQRSLLVESGDGRPAPMSVVALADCPGGWARPCRGTAWPVEPAGNKRRRAPSQQQSRDSDLAWTGQFSSVSRRE